MFLSNDVTTTKDQICQQSEKAAMYAYLKIKELVTKKNKDKMSKIQSLCQSCSKHTCRDHMTQTCDDCKDIEE